MNNPTKVVTLASNMKNTDEVDEIPSSCERAGSLPALSKSPNTSSEGRSTEDLKLNEEYASSNLTMSYRDLWTISSWDEFKLLVQRPSKKDKSDLVHGVHRVCEVDYPAALKRLEFLELRMLSFTGSPYDSRKFAKAGFFKPSIDEGMPLFQCFSCNLLLGGLWNSDDLLRLHLEFSPDCVYAQSCSQSNTDCHDCC